jgi:hypothetical protein
VERTYELNSPAPAAQDEWRKFELRDEFVRGLGDVRFAARDRNHTRLTIAPTREIDKLAIDAAVERFRGELARKGLAGEAADGGKPGPY